MKYEKSYFCLISFAIVNISISVSENPKKYSYTFDEILNIFRGETEEIIQKMNNNHTFEKTVESLFKGMDSFITSKTVVGSLMAAPGTPRMGTSPR